jgi:hypothetical protein
MQPSMPNLRRKPVERALGTSTLVPDFGRIAPPGGPIAPGG